MGAAAAVLRRGTRGLKIIALARPICNRLLRAGATAVHGPPRSPAAPVSPARHDTVRKETRVLYSRTSR
jgi:hypothetical protein